MIRVLVVDDDVEVCELIQYRLVLDGSKEFQTTLVWSDFERLLLPGAWHDVDCLVLDLWLTPDGISHEYPLAHRIFNAARAERPHLPVIIFSAVVALQHSGDIEANADMVLSKPSIDRIASAVLAVCHQRREGDELNRPEIPLTPLDET